MRYGSESHYRQNRIKSSFHLVYKRSWLPQQHSVVSQQSQSQWTYQFTLQGVRCEVNSGMTFHRWRIQDFLLFGLLFVENCINWKNWTERGPASMALPLDPPMSTINLGPCLTNGIFKHLTTFIFLPSATKLRRLCFYTCVSVHRRGIARSRGCLGGSAPRGFCSLGVAWSGRSASGGCLVQGDLLLGVCSQGCAWSQGGPGLGGARGVSGPGGVPGPGGVVSQHALTQTPPPADGYCCGRYASYWNAFLLLFKLFNTPFSGRSRSFIGANNTLRRGANLWFCQFPGKSKWNRYKCSLNTPKIR